jgi:hypothetical protein
MNPEAEHPSREASESADPLVDEVRRVRHEISAECGHDPYRLVEYYMRLQEQHSERLVGAPDPASKDQSAA